jgi:hypothetical protein
MIVYVVSLDYEANKKTFVTTLDPLDHISGKVASRIDEFVCTVEKKAGRWNPPAIEWDDDDGRNLDRYKDPDITDNPARSFMLGPRAAELLRPVISDVAELLPIPFQGETWYFMNVFNKIDAVDKANSRYKVYSTGRIGPVEKIVFSPEKIPHAKLFTIPESRAELFYAEHHPDDNPNTFKNVVEKNKLFGIRFGKVWEN